MKAEKKKMCLTYIDMDSFSRPVYQDEEGRLWKDTDPRAHVPANLCTCASFDGEPDTPINVFKQYRGAKITFKPRRVTW